MNMHKLPNVIASTRVDATRRARCVSDIYDDYFFYAIKIPLHLGFRFLELEMGRYWYLESVSVFGIFVGIFSCRFGIRYRYRYF